MKSIRRRKGMFFTVLVSYSFSSNIGVGFGSTTQFSTNRKVISRTEIKKMQDIIAKENGFVKVAILNYQFMT